MLSNAFLCCLGPTIWAYDSTYSLVLSLMSLNADTSLGISLIMPSSSSPSMNYTFSLLSYLLQTEPAAFVCDLSIHSGADFWLFLFHLRYCSDKTILL